MALVLSLKLLAGGTLRPTIVAGVVVYSLQSHSWYVALVWVVLALVGWLGASAWAGAGSDSAGRGSGDDDAEDAAPPSSYGGARLKKEKVAGATGGVVGQAAGLCVVVGWWRNGLGRCLAWNCMCHACSRQQYAWIGCVRPGAQCGDEICARTTCLSLMGGGRPQVPQRCFHAAARETTVCPNAMPVGLWPTGDIARVLACKDHFEVLGLDWRQAEALTDKEVKDAKRNLLLKAGGSALGGGGRLAHSFFGGGRAGPGGRAADEAPGSGHRAGQGRESLQAWAPRLQPVGCL